jgi:iron complex outermembrane receptor protein
MAKYWSLARALGIGVSVLAGAIVFQERAAAQAPIAEAAPIEKIEVTGTAIRRTDTETPSPVQVITAEEIKQSGYTTVSEVLRAITANNQGTLSQGFAGAFASGASGVALRGLTVAATLVLIDGHRMAPYPLADDGQRSFTDVSSLPFDAIDHIEVVKDSASALYGSDAIAGVVNVILKKSYKGANISGEEGWSQHGGGQAGHVSGIFGWGDLAQDGQNGFATLEYRHQNRIRLTQRPDLATLDWRPQGGQNQLPGGNNFAFGVTTPQSQTGYFVNPNAPVLTNPTAVQQFSQYGFLPGCNAVKLASDQCLIDPKWMEITPETENLNILTRYTRKLGSDWEASVSAALFQSKDTVIASYIPPFSTNARGFSDVGVGPGPKTYPFAIPGPFMAPVPKSVATQFGVPVGTLEPVQITLPDAPNTHVTNQTYRLSGDLTGSVANWDVTGFYGWTEAVSEQIAYDNPDLLHLYNALRNGTYKPGGPVPNSVVPPLDNTYKDILWYAGVHTSRDVLQLWGGPLSFAAGVDYYDRNLDANPNFQTYNGEQPSTQGAAFSSGNQSDWSVFGELDGKVIKSLELDVSGRFDHYNASGSDLTPKAGFKFQPIQQVLWRGTYSKGFRAPNPVENGNSGALGFATNIADPILCPNPTGPNGRNSPGNFPSQCQIPDVNLTTGTKTLQPEHSTSWTNGFVFEPIREVSASVDFFDIKVAQQIISALGIVQGSTVRSAAISAPYVCTGPTDPHTACAGQAAGATVNALTQVGIFAYTNVPYINLNQTRVRGLDLGVKAKFDLPANLGKITADYTWTHLFDYLFTTPAGTFNLAGTHGPFVISGDTATPGNRGQFITTWENGPFLVSTTVNYISGYSVTDPSQGLTTCLLGLNNTPGGPGTPAFPGGTTPPSQYCHVGSFTTVDLYTKWSPDKHWAFHATVDNLFDRGPPIDLETYGAVNYNPSLHLSGAIGRYFYVGASYTF